jgi:hypothetical protein
MVGAHRNRVMDRSETALKSLASQRCNSRLYSQAWALEWLAT